MAGMSEDIDYDQYGFERPSDFDHESYEAFMSAYIKVLARRSIKWEDLLNHGENNSSFLKTRKSKRYVRKGIPSEHRGEIWLVMSGAKKNIEQNPEKYNELLRGEKDDSIVELIQRDVRRTYPENVYFRDVTNSQLTPLANVLVCYAHYNKSIGYCQGFNYVVGMLLLVTKNEEQSFWLLVELVERLLPEFYSSKMLGLRVECAVVEELLKKKHPDLYSHFQTHQIDLNLTSSKWFICLYMDVLPVETVLRIWDCLFYEGSKVLLRVAFSLIVLNKQKFLGCKDFNEICVVFKEITHSSETLKCHEFMQNCFKVPGSFSIAKIMVIRNQLRQKLQDQDAQLRR